MTGCKGCRESTDKKSRTTAETQTKAKVQTFVTYKYIDPMIGIEAFRLLIPKGWQAEGAITWSTNPALPVQAHFRFSNPNSTEEFNLFPTQSYFWTNNQIFLSTNPPGSLRFGTLVTRPVDLHTAFTQVIIPQAMARATDLKIVQEKDVPELSQLAIGQPV